MLFSLCPIPSQAKFEISYEREICKWAENIGNIYCMYSFIHSLHKSPFICTSLAIVSIWLIRALFSFSCKHTNTNGMLIYMLSIIYVHSEWNLSVWHEINLASFATANLTSLLMQALRLLMAVSLSASAPRTVSISFINCSASWMDCFILQNHISHLLYPALASQYSYEFFDYYN